ncbi:helix-turn-helix domain-containing protein [Paenibacillus chitinolyticus]|nr:helix-turn-helix domain-containing protein [Paenibacillus chitinolyticus]MCY9589863.1 helix-turn-helix domain-containing protein [Paenibacillus chitinolyticus]MCY9598136.1 helix-turn-helix domain-containing protein [Paenibacillus chitinolyticus]
MNKAHFSFDLTQSCQIIRESIQLPVTCYGIGEPLELTGEQDTFYRGFLMGIEKLTHSFSAKMAELPILWTTNAWEQFIVLPVKRNEGLQQFILIGPAIEQTPPDELIHGFMSDNRKPYHELPHWKAYWSYLPIVSRLRLIHISVLAHWIINQEVVEISDVAQYSCQYVWPATFESDVEKIISEQRESSITQHSSEIEKQLSELIRTGNTTELLKMWSSSPQAGVGVLSKQSQLRNVKNLAICCVAFAMRAAVEGGLDEELAFTLSDWHIQQIEELNKVQAVQAVLSRAVMDFTERVAKSKHESMSRPIRICCEYMVNHLYKEITIEKLSELTGVNSNYLMNLFKEQTGMTLMNYLQEQRINEAKKLLKITNDTISSIGTRLKFYDQSHFTKVFKKLTDMTPRQYRSTFQTI